MVVKQQFTLGVLKRYAVVVVEALQAVEADYMDRGDCALHTKLGTRIRAALALAEFERELIVERTNAGLAAARARGRVGGRAAVLHSKEDIDAAVAMLKAGKDPREVGKRFGVSKSTIYSRIAGEWASALAEGTAK